MKLILISQGWHTKIDDKDFVYLNQFKWHLHSKGYVASTIKSKSVLMHRVIMNPPKDFETDHINHNKLDNRRSNLRIVTHKENMLNRNEDSWKKINGMTLRDLKAIRTLYLIGRYLPADIARLFGISPQRLDQIIKREIKQTSIIVNELTCQICGFDEVKSYFIDGNPNHNKPQNLIVLCEADKRKFQHMQLRKNKGVLTPQMESNLL